MVDRDSEYEDTQANEKVGYTFTATVESAESSMVPASVEIDHQKRNSVDLQSELEEARKEIAELKKQLSTITADRGAEEQ